MGEARWLKPEGSVETRVHRRLPGSELRRLNVEVQMSTYSLFATDHRQQVTKGNTISITTVVEVASGKGHA